MTKENKNDAIIFAKSLFDKYEREYNERFMRMKAVSLHGMMVREENSNKCEWAIEILDSYIEDE